MQLATHPDTDDLYRWEKGVYRNLRPTWARTVMTEASASASEHQVRESLFQATHRAPYLAGDRHGLDSETPRINFRNGVLDLATGELRPHGEPWNTTNQIPLDYLADVDEFDLEVNTLALDSFFGRSMAKDTVEARVPWQILGSAMCPGNPSQVFVVLQGPGGSGKSTFVGLLVDVLGEENVSTLTLKQLGDRFAAVGLHGVLANVAGDVAGGIVGAYELILSIIGGDKITADRKHRDPLAFDWDGLLIFATNGQLILPVGAGSESGWWRRALYLDMPHAVPVDQRVTARELRESIAPDLNMVATRAARELRTAWLAGPIPTRTQSMAQASAAARTSGNTVADWADDRLTPHAEGEVKGPKAYQDYKSWCDYYGHPPRGHRKFYDDLAATLSQRGWGQRTPGRDSTSRALFAGVTLATQAVWLQV